MTEQSRSAATVFLLYLFAFASGFAALVYQVAWSRMLSLTFGSSTLALSAVVAGFMGGMGIGAWLYHRVGDRIESAIRAYGLLEIGIALTTALVTVLYGAMPELFAAVAGHVPAGPTMDVFRVVAAILSLLLPAAIMGGTYPALCRVLLRTSRDVEGRLGWIYGLNTLGAALGAIVAGGLMIEWLGSTGAVRVANVLNLVIGLGSLGLARAFVEKGEPAVAEEDALESRLPYGLTALVLFGSGFATLGYEIVWFRALHYILGTGTYTLTALLAIFLLGLGLGGCLYRPILRLGRPEWALGAGQLAIASAAIFAVGAEHLVLIDPDLSNRFSLLATANVRPWQDHLTDAALVATFLLLPATILMGIVFPLASRLFLGNMEKITSRVGLAYLLSNLGSIAGAILAAVWILPTLGSLGGTKALVAVNCALGLAVLARTASRRALGFGIAVALVIGVVAIGLPGRFAFGVAGPKGGTGLTLEFEEESELGMVQVYAMPGGDRRSMAIDGVTVSATEAFGRDPFAKQVALAHLPMQLDWSVRRTLNLGLAGGSTLATLARYPAIEALDAVEISPAVVRGGHHFRDFAVLDDPRVEVVLEDAVHYLLTTERRYDLIINDAKEQIRFGGNAKILSREFYTYAAGALSECGLFAQAIGLTRDDHSLRMILRTLQTVFPRIEVFLVTPNMTVMVGSRCPIEGRAGPTLGELEAIGVAREIRKYFVPDAAEMAALWIGSGDPASIDVGEGPINDWNSLPLEFVSYRRPRADALEWAASMALVFAPPTPEGEAPGFFAALPGHARVRGVNRGLLASLKGDPYQGGRRIERILRDSPRHAYAREVRATIRRLFERSR